MTGDVEFCRCVVPGCPYRHADAIAHGRDQAVFGLPGAGIRSYGALTVVRTDNGPQIEGEIPNRIGVDRAVLTGEIPGTWSIVEGSLTLLHTKWRQIGMDGADVYVFERLPE